MRILMLNNEFPPLGGGTGTVNRALLQRWAQVPGIEIDLVTSALGKRHEDERFAERVHAGVVVVNAGTHGSEPHMGFGGVKDSGTGWREAGIESLDVYSDLKVVNLVVDPAKA